MINIEKYFGTFRSQFHEKVAKIMKKQRFIPDFYQILEKNQLFFLIISKPQNIFEIIIFHCKFSGSVGCFGI